MLVATKRVECSSNTSSGKDGNRWAVLGDDSGCASGLCQGDDELASMDGERLEPEAYSFRSSPSLSQLCSAKCSELSDKQLVQSCILNPQPSSRLKSKRTRPQIACRHPSSPQGQDVCWHSAALQKFAEPGSLQNVGPARGTWPALSPTRPVSFAGTRPL